MYPDSHPNPHIELGLQESAACEPGAWETWIAKVERLLGHSADGDQMEDGYSLDAFWQAFDDGLTPREAVTAVVDHGYGNETRSPEWYR